MQAFPPELFLQRIKAEEIIRMRLWIFKDGNMMHGMNQINRMFEIFMFEAIIILILTCAFPTMEAFAQQSLGNTQDTALAQSTKNHSVKELFTMIKKPTNPIDMLKNIKFAVENNLLMSDEITTDENLEKMFGSSKILWEKNSQNYRRVMVAGISYYCRRLDDKGMESAQGKLKIVIGFSGHNDTRFTVEAVQDVFGTDTQVINPYTRPNRSIALLPKTHSLGNMELIYNIENQNSKTTVSFLTKGNGIIKKVKLIQEEK
jgi:hypothetical protein